MLPNCTHRELQHLQGGTGGGVGGCPPGIGVVLVKFFAELFDTVSHCLSDCVQNPHHVTVCCALIM